MFEHLDELSIPRLIFEIAGLQMLDSNRLLKPFNITVEQVYILYCLNNHKNISQKELSDLTLKDQANTTRILKRLHEKELVNITGSKKDRRVNLVSLSEDGLALIKKLSPYVKEKESKVQKFLSDEELLEFRDMLKRYYELYASSPEMERWRNDL